MVNAKQHNREVMGNIILLFLKRYCMKHVVKKTIEISGSGS